MYTNAYMLTSRPVVYTEFCLRLSSLAPHHTVQKRLRRFWHCAAVSVVYMPSATSTSGICTLKCTLPHILLLHALVRSLFAV